MKSLFFIAIFALIIFLVFTIINKISNKEFVVGENIKKEDINEFYYTIASSSNPPEYIRYYFYVEDGKYYFMHEKREGNHWPLTIDDVTIKQTILLDENQWDKLFECLKLGIVSERNDDTETGNKGPFLYLYFKNDKNKYQEFKFETSKKQIDFEKMCLELINENQ